MELSGLDWAIIVAYLVITLGIGLAFLRRASGGVEDFFLSGRKLPWWIAGTSMVATTFAADTPLAVTGLTIQNGLAGNWFWWSMALGGMITVFLYSRLWRRAGVVTDVELVEIRYSGTAAAVLRGFRSIYFSLLINSIIIGWVTVAMMKVLKHTVFHGIEPTFLTSDVAIIAALLIITGIYCALSGLWGVAMTDFLQFFVAMAGCIALAVYAVASVGGINQLHTKVYDYGAGGGTAMAYIPDFFAEGASIPLSAFLIMLFVQWWATWYPGAEPGGGGYVVQRMAACKDERHAYMATLWFQIAHYAVRPWPWLLVAFVAMVRFPELATSSDPGIGFPMVIREVAPSGLRGLLLITFASAYMSTISTQLNWGASYLVNDFYRRFMRPDATTAQLSNASRISTGLVLIAGGGMSWLLRDFSVDQVWKYMAAIGAGTGAVYMLRWFWWRINAWSEISAMVGSLVIFVIMQLYAAHAPEGWSRPTQQEQIAWIAFPTILVWLVATFLTAPESKETLLAFYRRVRPVATGWGPIARLAPEVKSPDRMLPSLFGALLGSLMIYTFLPAMGFLIFGQWVLAAVGFIASASCAIVLWFLVPYAAGKEDSKPA